MTCGVTRKEHKNTWLGRNSCGLGVSGLPRHGHRRMLLEERVVQLAQPLAGALGGPAGGGSLPIAVVIVVGPALDGAQVLLVQAAHVDHLRPRSLPAEPRILRCDQLPLRVEAEGLVDAVLGQGVVPVEHSRDVDLFLRLVPLGLAVPDEEESAVQRRCFVDKNTSQRNRKVLVLRLRTLMVTI